MRGSDTVVNAAIFGYTFFGYTFLGYTFFGYTFFGNTFFGYSALGLPEVTGHAIMAPVRGASTTTGTQVVQIGL